MELELGLERKEGEEGQVIQTHIPVETRRVNHKPCTGWVRMPVVIAWRYLSSILPDLSFQEEARSPFLKAALS